MYNKSQPTNLNRTEEQKQMNNQMRRERRQRMREENSDVKVLVPSHLICDELDYVVTISAKKKRKILLFQCFINFNLVFT